MLLLNIRYIKTFDKQLFARDTQIYIYIYQTRLEVT